MLTAVCGLTYTAKDLRTNRQYRLQKKTAVEGRSQHNFDDRVEKETYN